MANGNGNNGKRDGDFILSGARVVAGISIVVVAALIIWLFSSTFTMQTRVSVLENGFKYMQCDISEMKSMLQSIDDKLDKDRHERFAQERERIEKEKDAIARAKGGDDAP